MVLWKSDVTINVPVIAFYNVTIVSLSLFFKNRNVYILSVQDSNSINSKCSRVSEQTSKT